MYHYIVLRRIYFLLVFILLTGCFSSRFPVVRPSIEVPANHNSKSRAKEYYIRARDYERRGLLESAMRYLEMAYELDPASKKLRDDVVRLYVESEKFTQALLLVKNNRNNDELDRESKRLVSSIYLKMKEFRKAADVLESIADKSDEEIYSLGLINESIGNDSSALNYYLLYYKRRPESIEIGFKIGKLLLNQKRFDAAESLFVVMNKHFGENPDLFTILGTTRILMGDTAAGIKYYTAALQLDSLHEDALRSAAQVYMAANKFPPAIAYYQKLYKSSSYGPVYGRTLSLLYYYNKQFAEAESLLVKLLLDGMDDYELHYYLGLVFFASEKYEMARMEFEKSLFIRNSYEDAWRELCYIYLHEKDYDGALEIAKRYVKVLSTSAAAWRLKGRVFNLRKEYHSAINDLKKSTSIDSSNAFTWFELGSAYERAKVLDSAAYAFKKVLRYQPGDPVTLNYLGYMWADKGVKLDSAKILIEAALEVDPKNGAFLDSYAWVYFQMGDLDNAYKYQKHALELITDDPTIFSHYGDILSAKKELDGAVAAYRKSIELNSEETELLNEKIRKLEELILLGKKQ